jgi:DNA-binding transcriptional regulator YhcF (GntR family)
MMRNYSEKEFNSRHGTIVPVPLYQLVRDRILLELYRNSYPAGSVLGTEGDLCRKFQVSRKTIRHAVHELEQAGYLKRKQKVGVVVTEKDLRARPPQTGTRKVILLLPKWNYTIGNRLERIIAHRLEMPEPSGQAFNVEMCLFHDPLPEKPDNLYAVIAADPPLQHLSTLERFAAEGVRVIAIEPRIDFHMSVNIRPDIRKAAHDAVGYLYRHGHRRIGLLSQAFIHFTFQQWLEGFLHAMSEYELPVLPRAILRNEELAECADSDLRRITAWLCPTQSNVECLSYRLEKSGLSVPGDVSIIGSDDPSGTELSGQKFPVTVYMPYSGELAHLLRRLLEMDPGTVTPGSVLYYPMTVIHRQSVCRCRL